MKTGKRKNTAAKWIIGILAAAAAAVLIFILSIFAIDPMFHYHAPLKFLSYPLVNERYQNNGGGYTEIGDNLKTAYDSGHDIKYVIWVLTMTR